MTRRALLPIASACREFLLVDEQVHAATGSINPDIVAIANECQRAADKRFRRYISDAHAARGAGEPPVRNQSHLLAHALAVDQRGDAKHLTHAGTPDGPFVTDHQDLASLVTAVANRCDASLFILEDARDALEE